MVTDTKPEVHQHYSTAYQQLLQRPGKHGPQSVSTFPQPLLGLLKYIPGRRLVVEYLYSRV